MSANLYGLLRARGDILFKLENFLTAIISATAMVFVTNVAAEDNDAIVKIDDQGRAYVIYDSSGSMWGELSDQSRKYEAGRTALSTLLENGFSNRLIALRAYGHRRKADCRDSELIVPFAEPAEAKQKVIDAVEGIRPTGKTPITYSLREALKDFDGNAGDILLISDGIETCDADPCALMSEWQASKVNIRVHVVGVGLNEVERKAMACIADTSGGKYFDADSAKGFTEALDDASDAIDEPVIAKPVDDADRFALVLRGADETGRSFRVAGTYYKGDEVLGPIADNGRTGVVGPGDYIVEAGAQLQDGSAYKPTKTSVTVSEPGDTIVDILVTRPASVSAKFTENGVAHRGSNVTAYQDSAKVFTFRSFDEALARPGEYDFRATPNTENELVLTETLIEGEATELLFELVNTIEFYVEFVLPNGETFKRASELWRDGERVYKVYGNRNPTTIIPGIYELRAEDQNLPLTPVEIEITENGKTYQVPIDAGWIKFSYAPSDYNYVGNKQPNNAFLESLDRGNAKYARVNTLIPVKPGRYKVNPRTEKGFMDPIEAIVASGQTVEVEFTPKPVGEILVDFAASDKWTGEPDRAFVTALEGQRIIKGYMVPGRPLKFAPGRYQVKGGGKGGGDAVTQEITVNAGERTTVILKHKQD